MTEHDPHLDEPDDVEGHRMSLNTKRRADSEAGDDEDDVVGHVQPPPDFEHLDR